VRLKDSELNAIIEAAKAQGTPTDDDEVLKVGAVQREGGCAYGSSGSDGISDRQFRKAAQSVHRYHRYHRSGADFFRRKLNSGDEGTACIEQLEDLDFIGLVAQASAGQGAKLRAMRSRTIGASWSQ
jgi:hypothetical protein